MSSLELERIEAELAEVRKLLEGRLLDSVQVVSLERAAELLSVSTRTIRRMVQAKELLTVQVGKLPKVPMSELRRVATPRASVGEQLTPTAAAARKMRAHLAALPLGTKRPRTSPAAGEAAAIRARLAARKAKR